MITTGGNDKTVIVWETDFGFGPGTAAAGGSPLQQLEDSFVEDPEFGAAD